VAERQRIGRGERRKMGRRVVGFASYMGYSGMLLGL
jgi:hypothetical protein